MLPRGAGAEGPVELLQMVSFGMEPQWCGHLFTVCGRHDKAASVVGALGALPGAVDAFAVSAGAPPLDVGWIAVAGTFGLEVCRLSWSLDSDNPTLIDLTEVAEHQGGEDTGLDSAEDDVEAEFDSELEECIAKYAGDKLSFKVPTKPTESMDILARKPIPLVDLTGSGDECSDVDGGGEDELTGVEGVSALEIITAQAVPMFTQDIRQGGRVAASGGTFSSPKSVGDHLGTLEAILRIIKEAAESANRVSPAHSKTIPEVIILDDSEDEVDKAGSEKKSG